MSKTVEIGTGLEIAVIGMAGRFPGAGNIHEFWDNLKNGIETISFYSKEEMAASGINPALLNNANYVKAHGSLSGIEYFDASFFGYTPKEAEIMDPQVRIFHECVWTALEDAGYDSTYYDGLIGLYTGAPVNLNWEMRVLLSGKSREIGDFATQQLTRKDLLSLRISYKLNLTGPSMVLSTTCSTSLVAIHVAYHATLNGECDMALAGGIAVSHLDKTGYIFQEGMINSPDGHCRAFAADAKGTLGGNGAGVIVLKRLEDAVLHRDHIYAVIKGSAINNDGIRKAGFTASSVEGQAEVIKMAQQMAEVEPESVSFIETHGTGTELGDPVEIEALRLAFHSNKKGFCAIGAVKANLGHLDTAAGAAGFIKTVLALQHKLIPPTLHVEIPNPRIDFIDSPFYLNTRLTPWENGGYPLRAGVSAFGIGGTNAHVILEEAPPSAAAHWSAVSGAPGKERQHQLIIVSAHTLWCLEKMKENLARYFKENPDLSLADAAYTLQVGRKTLKHRWMSVCSTTAEAGAILDSPDSGESGVVPLEKESAGQKKVEPPGNPDKNSLMTIGRLWLHGHQINWKGFYSQEKRYRVSLPTYPFAGERYWIESQEMNPGIEALKPIPDLADWFYLPTWKRSLPLQKNKSSRWNRADVSKVKRCWLVFPDQAGVGQLLVKHLEDMPGHWSVIRVEMAPGFARRDDHVYTINPRESHDYEVLFNELTNRHLQPVKIVHCWNVTGKKGEGGLDRETFDKAQYPGFFSLLFIARALGKQNYSHDLHITILTDHVQEVCGGEPLRPEKSTVLGLMKSIPQEYPGISCTNIDIQLPEPGALEKNELIDVLLKELNADPVEPVIAYRNNQRWVQVFDPFHWEPLAGKPPVLREKGVYLITGGMGEIGLMFAELFIKHTGARVVLTGRSGFPARHEWNQWLDTHDASEPIYRKIKKLQTLEEMGGEVIYFQADAANPGHMRDVVSRVEESIGPINGVIHAAGGLTAELMLSIQDLTPDRCQLQFQTKVYGLMVLEEIFKPGSLDFCWMLSSISCVLGGLGFGAYASANGFMDSFVKEHNRLNPAAAHWFSLNWDGMDTKRSISIFERIFALDKVDQLVVSREGNLHARIERWIKLETLRQGSSPESLTRQTSSIHPRPHLSTAYAAPANDLEQAIVNIWQGLLGYDEIGTRDDFLELGGDSLKAITVISRIHQELHVNVPVSQFFNKPTVEGIAGYISRYSAHDAARNENLYVSLVPVEKKEYYPLSFSQRRLYILQQMETGSISYNMPYMMALEAGFAGDRLQHAFRKLIQRHESLRTGFEIVGNEPVQKIHDEAPFEIEHYLVAASTQESGPTRAFLAPEGEQELRVKSCIKNFIRPFDLSRAPLLRVGLLRLEPGNHILMVDMHHIISDGISLGIMLKDLMILVEGKEPAPLPLQNKDFAQWQNQEKIKVKIKKQEKFWLDRFRGQLPQPTLPTDYTRPVTQQFTSERIPFEIDEETTKKLKKLMVTEKITLFMMVLTIYYIFLAKLTGEEDIIVGTGVDIRKDERQQQIMGMFINTLALRNYPRKEKPFKEFLQEVREQTLLAYDNQDYPFEDLVEKIAPKRDWNRNPLFDAFIMSQDMHLPSTGTPGQTPANPLPFTPYQYMDQFSKFDIFLFFKDSGDRVTFLLDYRVELFKKEAGQRFIDYIKDIIFTVVQDIRIPLQDIKISHTLATCQDRLSQGDYTDFNF